MLSLSVEQLQTVVENRSDSTVILLDKEIVGFANFCEVKTNESCSIGNVIVSSNFRNKGIGKYLMVIMESIALERYNVKEIHISCFNTNLSLFEVIFILYALYLRCFAKNPSIVL